MAATLVATLPKAFGSADRKLHDVFVYQLTVSSGEVNTDLLVRGSAGPNVSQYLVGWLGVEASSGNLILKSGTMFSHTLEMASWQGFGESVGDNWIFGTKEGDGLIVNSSYEISSLLLYLVETTGLRG
jgi:hypothetical protein